jgi:hypothetical protein
VAIDKSEAGYALVGVGASLFFSKFTLLLVLR